MISEILKFLAIMIIIVAIVIGASYYIDQYLDYVVQEVDR